MTADHASSAYIASVAAAAPAYCIDQRQAADQLLEHYGERLTRRSRAAVRKVFAHPSIQRRHFAFSSPKDLFTEDADARVVRFTHWSVELSARAIERALRQVGLGMDDVAALVVNTCTGYICPGVSTYLLERLGLDPATPVYDLVGSGCGGAVPNLRVAEGLLSDDRVVVSASVEICSATFRMGDDLGLIISNALFGDAAAAAVLWRRPQGLAIVDTAGVHASAHREHIRYVHRDGQLYNQLSLELPEIVKKPVGQLVRGLLDRNGMAVGDVAHWVLHPGGAKIVDAVQEALGLSEAQVAPTRRTLAEYGNLSSASVWFVLRDILANGMADGDTCLMTTFGAGFAAYAALLRADGLPAVGEVVDVGDGG